MLSGTSNSHMKDWLKQTDLRWVWSRWAELWTDPESVMTQRHAEDMRHSSSRQMCTRGSLWPQISFSPEEIVSPSCVHHHVASSLSDEAVTCRCGRHAELLAYADVWKSWCTDFIPESTLRTEIPPGSVRTLRIWCSVDHSEEHYSETVPQSVDAGFCTLVNNWWCFYTWSCDGPAENYPVSCCSTSFFQPFFPLKSTLRRVAEIKFKMSQKYWGNIKCLSLFLRCFWELWIICFSF